MALLISILKKSALFLPIPLWSKTCWGPTTQAPSCWVWAWLRANQSWYTASEALNEDATLFFNAHRCFSSSFPLWLFHLLSSVVKLVRAIGPNKRSNSRTAPHHAHLLLRHCVILSVFCPTAFSFLWLFVFKTIYFLKYWWPYNVYNFNLNP